MCCQPSHTEVKTQTPQCGRPCQSLPKGEGSPSEPTIRETEEILFPHSHHTPRGLCPETDKKTAFVAKQSRLKIRFLILTWIFATLRPAVSRLLNPSGHFFTYTYVRTDTGVSAALYMLAIPFEYQKCRFHQEEVLKKIEEKKKNYMGTTGNNWPGMF